jgi:hypothetical protein
VPVCSTKLRNDDQQLSFSTERNKGYGGCQPKALSFHPSPAAAVLGIFPTFVVKKEKKGLPLC